MYEDVYLLPWLLKERKSGDIRPRKLPFIVGTLRSAAVAATVPTTTPTLHHTPEHAHNRRALLNRTGLIAYKRGMITYFDSATGNRHAATILDVDRCQVTHTKTRETDQYFAVQLGLGAVARPDKNVTRQMLGHFARAQVAPKPEVAEFHVANADGLLPIGTLLPPSYFEVGKYVDVRAHSKGKGFQGVMKRWGFKGLRASHGTSVSHRHGGSYGMNQTPGRVLPGKKMPGHMGNVQCTVRNLKVLDIDDSRGTIIICGAVPGPNGAVVKIEDALKHRYNKN
ncbi:translation protein [Nadsonia fulvescens var. elongata DSM 6958]|uniref:Large ribosomal subunit protein uL3m n=1 Tax=Nadsonia fulvescens var. elongata DSM 6958 TaxID=857566 RepID=A0A1E3PR40_9ASCO|nr:translation protein [Nadsonia fulvescens var. elongata DSM 6958]